MDPLADFWENLLSQEPARILEAWKTLTVEEQDAVIAHLARMTTEDGWAAVQRQSAAAALSVLRAHDDSPQPPAGTP